MYVCINVFNKYLDFYIHIFIDNKVFWLIHTVTRTLNLSYVYCGQQDFIDFETDVWMQAAALVSFLVTS